MNVAVVALVCFLVGLWANEAPKSIKKYSQWKNDRLYTRAVEYNNLFK